MRAAARAATLAAAVLACAAPPPTAAVPPLQSIEFHTSDGVRLHVLEAGPAGHAPVIALVPGWSMPAAIFRPQLEGLRGRHRVAALDPRGQGRSEVPASGFDLARRATDVREFVERYPRVVLIGWSLGALEALESVRRFGEDRIAGLVLVDSSVGEPPAPPPSKFPDALRRDRTAALNDFVRAIFRTPRPADDYRSLVEGAQRMPLDASLALLAYPVRREHWRDIARGVRVPLLYVVTPQFAAQAKGLALHRPATEIAVFERAGHALFADEPARFNALVDAFAARVDR